MLMSKHTITPVMSKVAILKLLTIQLYHSVVRLPNILSDILLD